MIKAHTLARWFATTLFALGLHAAALAQEDPPGRVGRLSDLQGPVSVFDHEQGQWGPAIRNLPLTTGDRLATGPDGRAELRIGSTVLRLGERTELEVQRLDDERMKFQLHSGQLALRVRSREVADDIEVFTAEARLRPQRTGHFRIDRQDDVTLVGSWRGEIRVQGEGGPIVTSGQRVELWREGPQRDLRYNGSAWAADALADWAQRADANDERLAASRYVSPEMTGVEDLDRYGRWDQHPEFGAIWVPLSVAADWAPYRQGRWTWVRPWGWTWVDDAPWGFAPFHYGRWVTWSGRWCWVPGQYVARPVYAPALVGWVGQPRVGVQVNIGSPPVSWVPLHPREHFVPGYAVSPRYHDRVNGPGRGERPVPTGPISYTNQGVPGAVTVVPRDALQPRPPQPQQPRVGGDDGDRRRWQPPTPPVQGQRPQPGQATPQPPFPPPGFPRNPQQPVMPVPGGAVPVVPERPHERGPDRPHERPQERPQDRPQPPMSAPERAMERQAQPVPPAQPVQQAPVQPAPAIAPPRPRAVTPPPPAPQAAPVPAPPAPPPARENPNREEQKARAPESRNNQRERENAR